MNTDFSSGALPAGIQTYDVNNVTADAERNWFVRLFTGTSEADKQDFNRAEMSANNQYLRDLALQNNANAFSHSEAALARDFNASEAQKQRDFEERMSSTAYQRAVEDMKIAGISPALLLGSQGGASTPQGVSASASSASASSARSGGSNYHNKVQDNSAMLVAAFAGLIAKVALGLSGSGQTMGKIGFGD